MRSALLPDAVVIVRPGRSKDRYGNDTPDWTSATRTAAYGRLVARAIATQGNGEVHNAVRIAVEGAWALILPAGTAIDQTCRVELEDGTTYRVEGKPIVRRTMSRVHHITASLKEVS